jgi:hypothetical protein
MVHKFSGPGIARCAQLSQEPAGESLFDRLHYFGGIAALRFAQQKVDVLGHHHVADDHKTVATAHSLQNLQEEIAMLRPG